MEQKLLKKPYIFFFNTQIYYFFKIKYIAKMLWVPNYPPLKHPGVVTSPLEQPQWVGGRLSIVFAKKKI
jgi:hypothetical protein